MAAGYTNLHWADILVFSLALLFSLAIGAYYGWKGRRQQELQDYLLGGRRLPFLPVALSLFMSFQSGVSIIGIPAEMYMYGTMYSLHVLGLCLSLLLCCCTFVPLMYNIRLTSVYQYLEMRYKSKAVRMFGTLLGMLQTTVYLGLTLYTPALSLYTVAGVPLWLSIVVIGIIGTVYTVMGGMRSVVWTEVYQCIMIVTGIVAIIVKGLIGVEGFSKISSTLNIGRRISLDADPRVRHTVWSCLIGSLFTWLSVFTSQSSIQRIVCLKSSKAALSAFLLYIPMILLYTTFLSFIGLLMYTYYNIVRCDPLDSGILENLNQLMPYFAFQILEDIPGLSGLFICTIFSGALSILTSGINALSVNTVVDVFGAWLENTTKISATLAAKIAVICHGVVVIGLAYLIGNAGGPFTQISLSISGAFGGPLVGLFFLGGLFPQANWIGGLTGTIVSLILNTWICVGAQIYGKTTTALPPNPIDGCHLNTTTAILSSIDTSTVENGTFPHTSGLGLQAFSFYDLSYLWYGLMGFLMTIIIGLPTSFAAKTLAPSYVDDSDTRKEFIFYCCRRFMKRNITDNLQTVHKEELAYYQTG